MYSISHKNALKTVVVTSRSKIGHCSVKRQSKGSQDALVLSLQEFLTRSVRDSVSFFRSCCDPRCCCCHMPTWVRDTTILALPGGLEMSVWCETAGGN